MIDITFICHTTGITPKVQTISLLHTPPYHFTVYIGHEKGPSTTIAIELSNLSEIVNVHIAQVKVPITLLSVHDADHYDYHVVSGNWIYHFLKISKPIFLIHRDCNRPIHTATMFLILDYFNSSN